MDVFIELLEKVKIIYNKYFPIGKFWATNVLGVIFCRIDKGKLKERDINHEYIHTLQQREMLYVGFAIWYYIEWFIRFVRTRKYMQSYYDLYFEKEAYKYENDLDYRNHRKHFAWWQFVSKDSLLGHLGQVIGEVADFIREDFHPIGYLFAFCMAILVIVGQLGFNIYDILLAPSYEDGTSMLRLPLVYVCMYYAILIPTVLLHHEGWRLRQWQVWVLPVILVSIDGMGQGFDTYKTWILEGGFWHKEEFYLTLFGSYFFRAIFILTCLFFIHRILTGRWGWFGLVRSGKYLDVYGLIYLILVPIFIVVSFTPQFLDFYPKMNIDYCRGSFGWSDAGLILPFELCYSVDYLAVESMFRGALIIGLVRWLGPRTVLPMALTYMCVHLGKPDLELCSSVIGGYTLGILAYRTGHLWGGVIIHLGIALLFELLGLLRMLLIS